MRLTNTSKGDIKNSVFKGKDGGKADGRFVSNEKLQKTVDRQVARASKGAKGTEREMGTAREQLHHSFHHKTATSGTNVWSLEGSGQVGGLRMLGYANILGGHAAFVAHI